MTLHKPVILFYSQNDENIDFEALRLYIWTRAVLRNR